MATVQDLGFGKSLTDKYYGDVLTPWGLTGQWQGLSQEFLDRSNSYLDTFNNSFKTLVGRDATADEQKQFVNQYITPNITQLNTRENEKFQDPYTYIDQYVGHTFQDAAKKEALTQLEGQKSQAADLAQLFRQQGNASLSNVESSLMDYQNRLFERLRPNLITSLQAQGLLNTGGLNEALAGASKDLSDSAQASLLDARLQNENQANAIEYGGAVAPYNYQQGLIQNQVPYMQQQAQNAMQNAYGTFMSNLDYQHQLGLMAYQNKLAQENRPSFLQNMSTGFSTNLGASAGQSLGKWLQPPKTPLPAGQ